MLKSAMATEETALNGTRQRLLALCRLDRTWLHGQGVWLHDEQGRRFLDGYAQYGAVALGHNAPAVVAAVQEALASAEPALVQPYRAPHAEELARVLCQLAPGRPAHCVFTTSGAEAVEAAIKLVRSRTGRPLILSAEGSFHGKTLAALAATGQPHHGRGFGPLPEGFEHLPFGDLCRLAECLARKGAEVAAVLLEPIQGERGVYPPPAGYLAAVRELCTRHGVALILDEVQTGLGRTGSLFACAAEGVAPDVLLLAKALGGGLFPLGACLIADAFWDEHFALRHSSTFANNNIACRVGCAVLRELTEGLCREVERKGAWLAGRLRRLAQRFPRTVADVRGRGLLAAIELRPPDAEAGSVLSVLQHHGLYAYAIAGALAELESVLLLPTLGERPVLRVSPPLVISDDELELLLDGVERVLALLEDNPARTLVRTLGLGSAAPRRALYVPPPVAEAPAGPARYAFLVHPTRPEDLRLTNPGLEELHDEEIERLSRLLADMPPGLVLRAPIVRSPRGQQAEGLLISVPLLPAEMARRGPRQVSRLIAAAVDLAAHLGARVVGLGGHTTSYSRRGQAVVGRGPTITTGNALTAGMAFTAIERAARRYRLDLDGLRVGIVGARGSVGSLCARLFARAGRGSILLIGNPATGCRPLQELRDELTWGPGTVEVSTDLEDLAGCAVVVTASGAGKAILDEVPLRTGALVCDVARPPDVSARLRLRADLRVFDGGLVSLPDPQMRFGAGNLLGLPDGVQVACLCETILLALEADGRDHGVGDRVGLEEVDYALHLARRHGFRLADDARPAVNAHGKRGVLA